MLNLTAVGRTRAIEAMHFHKSVLLTCSIINLSDENELQLFGTYAQLSLAWACTKIPHRQGTRLPLEPAT